MTRQLWIDTRGQPVITTTPNGERNAKRWGWTAAFAMSEETTQTTDEIRAIGKVLVEHRSVCSSSYGVSPKWEECSCGERFFAWSNPPWHLLADHQAQMVLAALRRIDR